MSESSSSTVHPLTSKRRTQSSRIIRMHRPSIGNLLLCVNVFITCGINLSSSLKILMLDVPSPAIVGESVELTCSYDLEGDKLYSVKWYKNDAEFYRYVPKDWPPGQFLPMNGIRVDVRRSFCSLLSPSLLSLIKPSTFPVLSPLPWHGMPSYAMPSCRFFRVLVLSPILPSRVLILLLLFSIK